MILPQHSDPRENRRARAPYNFVPLPEKVVEVKDPLPDQDRYDPELHTGYIDCTLKTKSYFYVRGPLNPEDFKTQETRFDEEKDKPYREQIKNKPDFFYINPKTKDPVIPGSSLRGMLRTLVEIAGYGKLEWVPQKQLFFRTVDPTSVGKHYNKNFVSGSGTKGDGYRSKARGGIWQFQPDGSGEIKECTVARVRMEEVAKAFGLKHKHQLYRNEGPNAAPKWEYQHRTVWVQTESEEQDYPSRDRYLRYRKVTSIKLQETPDHSKGTLVLTGPMQNKKLAFVFLEKKGAQQFQVPTNLVRRFHDDDQLTQWQERAFPRNQPRNANRSRSGFLRDGEPVFFLTEADPQGQERVRFFGRAQLFRLPYAQRPIDLVLEAMGSSNRLDLANAVFGFARSGKRDREEAQQSCGGRVYVCDGIFEGGELVKEPITPRILATPKPTAFQHYLVQQSDDKRALKHYDNPPGETAIRGHKLYWHKNNPPLEQIKESGRYWLNDNGEVKSNSTQHTQMLPLKPGSRFRFRIYFDNLRKYELGALLWVLTLPGPEKKEYRHKFGMGKPLGLGSVHIEEVNLHLSDRQERYSQLFDETGEDWHLPPVREDPPSQQDLICAFEEFVLVKLDKDTNQRLSDLPRIRVLLTMLKWPGPDRDETSYMELGEFKERKVLPAPEGVASSKRGETRSGSQSVSHAPDVQSQPAATSSPPMTLQQLRDALGRREGAEQKPIREGDKVKAEVVARDGDRITVRIIGAQSEEVTFIKPYYPHRVGQKVKLEVQKLDENGRIISVTP